MTSRSLIASLLMLTAGAVQAFGGASDVNLGLDVRLDEMDGRSRAFVDLCRTAKWSAARVDEDGWPAADARAIFFDLSTPSRAIDPAGAIPDYSGTYRLSFRGQASLDASGGRIDNQRYDEAANTSTADIEVPLGTVSLSLAFSNTRRSPSSATGSGVTEVSLIRPGYSPGTAPVFTSDFLRALAPFRTLGFRAVQIDGSNDTEPLYPATTEWGDRHVPSDATQQQYGGRRKNGPAYEFLVLLANMTGKDLWINIPISASNDYVLQAAGLLHQSLRPDLKVYVEYSQSVFNSAGPGYRYVDQAVSAAAGDAQLNDPPAASRDEVIHRWHARRLIEIRNLFESVFGEAGMRARVRIVERWWYQAATESMEEYPVLRWVDRHFGPPSKFFYGISTYHMFYDTEPRTDVAHVVDAYRKAADEHFDKNVRVVQERAAAPWELKTLLYAAGPSMWMISAGPAHAQAFRADGMGEVFAHDLRDNWLGRGGDVYMYWGLAGAVERLVEDVRNLDTPAYRVVRTIAGWGKGPSVSAIVSAEADSKTIRPGTFATIWGDGFTVNEVSWSVATPSWTSALPNALDGVIVRIGGKDCSIAWVSSNQVNILVPGDLEPGAHEVEVWTNGGEARSSITLGSRG